MLLLKLPLLWAAVSSTAAALECKCKPSESCWPSELDWSSFNNSISGRLLKTVLPASVCYKSDPQYNADQCSEVVANWTTAAFHSNNPVSLHGQQWANNSCDAVYPNGTSLGGDPLAGSRGCSLGRYPPYVVNATDAADVQAAVKFAKRWNLRLNVKNTGHGSYRSAAPNSLSIWTHNLKGFTFHEKSTPQCESSKKHCNGEPRMAVTIGAGEQDDDLFQAAAKHNAAVVGGTNKDVGFLGWSLGGGHGWLTSEFGNGADNYLEAKVVTPNGDLVVANENRNSDLFWALRGGGGGTVGIVVEATIKAWPMPQATVWTLSINNKNTNCTSCWWDLMARVHSYLPDLKKGGFQGNYYFSGPPSSEALSFFGLFFLYNKPNGTAESLIKPLMSYLGTANETADAVSKLSWSPSWIDVYNSFPDVGGAGGSGGATTSRLLPARSLTEDPELLARTLELVGPSATRRRGGISSSSVSGSMALSSVDVDNALHPAWREAVVHLVVSESWRDDLPYAQTRAVQDEVTNVLGAALRRLAPASGAYLNEADAYEPNWADAFWGPKYPKLRAIKKKYDPNAMLWCLRCPGSEDWYEDVDGSLCRVR
ncbi:FAD binding domain protein [Metarhizium acridum CQMa 102]|uniref:FAD binding domain protein n=1 Tax=Metarhizium acridum (strain CQMa 102) TaxID=655827 RepID=E9EI15_METAQ|nr:FAD binding domain protein [Metarhizium acridum CQMa 102]EFY84435.1 FAD binding domain protein [Metarhizium acridum CQMa 102]